VPPFDFLRVNALSGELGRLIAQLFRHAGVATVAPYSSRRRTAISQTRWRDKKLWLIRHNVTPLSFPFQSTGQACRGVHGRERF
jgi:hypothetical protein